MCVYNKMLCGGQIYVLNSHLHTQKHGGQLSCSISTHLTRVYVNVNSCVQVHLYTIVSPTLGMNAVRERDYLYMNNNYLY